MKKFLTTAFLDEYAREENNVSILFEIWKYFWNIFTYV